MGMNLRNAAWCIAASFSVSLCIIYGLVTESFDTPSHLRVWLFPLIGAAGMAMVFFSRSIESTRSLLILIWIPAVLMRMVLFPSASSDDINRYLWEGKLVAEGISPYSKNRDAKSWLAYRDQYWEAMNHKDKATVYPPLSELIFGSIAKIAYHPMALKGLFVLADLLTLGGVLVLLRRRGTALAYAGFYAFNPVILLSFAGEGHFDSLMVATLVWAVVAYDAGRFKWAVVLASLATGVKWITLPLIPFFAGIRLFLGALIAILTLLIPAVYFWDTLPQLFEGLFYFGGSLNFNGPVYASLLSLGTPRIVVSLMLGLALCGVILWRWFSRESKSVDSHLRWIIGTLVVLSPTVHLWYLAWILPFVCLRPSLPWLMFSLTGGSYFYVWINAKNGEWRLEFLEQVIFWGPFFAACIYEILSTRGRVVLPQSRVQAKNDSIAVVIPSLNAAKQLPIALASVEGQTYPAHEVIIVDAGSDDGALDIAKQFDLPIQVIDCGQGRGQQIATGIEASEADWVVVLHADTELNPDSLEQIQVAVQCQPDVIGGALGQRFNEDSRELLPIELLNDLRALFLRTAFGDQTQFFHRETALRQQLMPRQPLMEDVESSWRVRECGAFIFLGRPTRACDSKWQAKDWLKRFTLVMRLVTRYRIARLSSRAVAEGLTLEMYREYYGFRK